MSSPADLVALEGKDYYKAIGLYERVGTLPLLEWKINSSNLLNSSKIKYPKQPHVCIYLILLPEPFLPLYRKWSVKEYLLKAGICSLATGDIVGMNTALERYRDLDPSFTQQREHQLLVDLTQAVSEVFSPNPQLFD